jgi:uncharacterized protein DUF3606
MPDNPKKTGFQDRIRISLEQEHELDYWTKKFGCSRARLREVVKEVGPMVKNIQRALADTQEPDDSA